ncbi:NACHT domain-containing protein [Nostoc sp. C117]|uniref:NACHT domain-containing protein n=1 Tax=Nostoc sp. C117 TaxID=3349875 RepID=UPI00370DC1EB
MTDRNYKWERFWYKAGSASRVSTGFLEVYRLPSQKIITHPDAVLFQEISKIPCLVMLGESGMGKTHTLDSELNSIPQEDKVLFVNLGACGSELTLYNDLFNSADFLAWTQSTYCLHLFLDGLDECQSRIPNICERLIIEFNKHKDELNRLFLRIACRTGSWGKELEQNLKKIWNNDAFGLYELAQLTADDVKLAATDNSINPDEFLAEIHHKQLVPLAARPVTLKLLLAEYQDGNKQLPSNQADLYLKGCQRLCRERTELRQQLIKLDEHQCLAVAARIAAISIFTGRPVIWKGIDLDAIPDRDATITVEELIGGNEYFERNGFKNEISVDKDAVIETLSKGFFTRYSNDSADKLVWTHQSYAEFLAAWYIKQQGLALPQVKSLLFHPDGRLVPQLHGTAAWVVYLIPEMFQEIINSDPEVILKGNINTESNEDRSKLVTAILQLCEENKIVSHDLPILTYGDKFYHPNLSQQLKACIEGINQGNELRKLAIYIARVCELKELQSIILSIALDFSQSMEVRQEAAKTICSIADEEIKAQLKPLINENPEDELDTLRGYALKATWPKYLSATELFSVITFPQKPNSFGAYENFLTEDLVKDIQPNDLLVALEWVKEQQIWFNQQLRLIDENGTGKGLDSSFRKLIISLISKGFEFIDYPGVIESLAETILTAMFEYQRIGGSSLEKLFELGLWNDDNKRYKLLVAISDLIVNKSIPFLQIYFLILAVKAGSYSFLKYTFSKLEGLLLNFKKIIDNPNLYTKFYSLKIVRSEDFSWLINSWKTAITIEHKKVWINFLLKIFNLQNREHIEQILYIINENIAELKEAFSPYIDPIELDSEQANYARNYYYNNLELDNQYIESKHAQEAEISLQEINQTLNQLLDKSLEENLDAWWQLNYWISYDLDNKYLLEYEVDLEKLPIWQNLDFIIYPKIIEAAKHYVCNQIPNVETWVGKAYRPASAGYRAFYILLKQEKNFIFNLPKEIWNNWTPIIIDYGSRLFEQNEVKYELVKIAYDNNPETTIQTVLKLIDIYDEEEPPYILALVEYLRDCWDNCLIHRILSKLEQPRLKLETWRNLLEILIKQNSQEVRNILHKFIESLTISEQEVLNTTQSILDWLSTVINNHLYVRWWFLPLLQQQLLLLLIYFKSWQEPIIAASTLLSFAEDAGWSFLWPLFQQNSSFGRAVVEDAIRYDNVFVNIGSRLSEGELADFFIWLAHQYPYAEDPKHYGIYTRGIRDYIAELKSAVLKHIRERGTPQAVVEVQRIKSEFPELLWLNSVLLYTQAKTRSQTWPRPLPQDILGLARNRQVRLIRSGDELLNLVYESLERLENKLQDNESLPVMDLWNKVKISVLKKLVLTIIKPLYKIVPNLESTIKTQQNEIFKENLFTPKDEDDLSSYVKRHLDNELKPLGMIVSREVEINRTDYVDLRIDCTSKYGNYQTVESFSVIIEVKGTWNEELNTSMKEQLFDRYLSDISCQHGVYLIGWFYCDKWSKQDYRKSDAQRYTKNFTTLEAAKNYFEIEAIKISQPNKKVKSFVLNVSLP